MKATGLMIGDWVMVKFTQHPTTVTNIDGNSVYTEAAFPLRYDEIEPIPITKGILKKNGFKKDTGGEECWSSKIGWFTPHEYDDNFKEKSWEVELCGEPNSFDGVITYVHQLQHALRLCGIKKGIII